MLHLTKDKAKELKLPNSVTDMHALKPGFFTFIGNKRLGKLMETRDNLLLKIAPVSVEKHQENLANRLLVAMRDAAAKNEVRTGRQLALSDLEGFYTVVATKGNEMVLHVKIPKNGIDDIELVQGDPMLSNMPVERYSAYNIDKVVKRAKECLLWVPEIEKVQAILK